MAADEEKPGQPRKPVQVIDLLETRAMLPLIAQAHAAARLAELEAEVRRRRDALLTAYHRAGRTYAQLASPVSMKPEGVSRAIDRYRALGEQGDAPPVTGDVVARIDTTDDRPLEVAKMLLDEVQHLQREETHERDRLIVELAGEHRISKLAEAIGLSDAGVASVIERYGRRGPVR